MQPLRKTSPDRVPPGRNSPFSIHQLIYAHHLTKSMQRTLPAYLRRYHRKLALSVIKGIKTRQRASYEWKTHCLAHLPQPPEPLLPLT
jgi:hypothetical protein